MSARRRNLQCALDILLSHDMAKVQSVLGRSHLCLTAKPRNRASGKMLCNLRDRLRRINLQLLPCKRCLLRIFRRKKQPFFARIARRKRHGQHTRHRTQRAGKLHLDHFRHGYVISAAAHGHCHVQRAGQRQLPDEHAVLRQGRYLPVRRQNPHQNREIVHRSLLADVRGREVDNHLCDRKFKPTIFCRGAHALT